MNNTLLKGLGVLELLSHSDRPLTLTQIAGELRIVKSNLHRLMQALSETRYVIRDDETGGYMASIKLWELGSAVLAKLDLRHHAERPMEKLPERTDESVHLSVLDRDEVVYVHKLESPNPARAYTQIGGRAPACCVATGKALLAHCSEAALNDIARKLRAYTPHTITGSRAFLGEMKRIRAKGYAINRGEWRPSVWGIASPIMDARGSVIAAVGISGPAERFRKRRLGDSAKRVVEAAVAISASFGGARDGVRGSQPSRRPSAAR